MENFHPPSLLADVIFCLGGHAEAHGEEVACASGLPVTNTILASWLAIIVVIAISLLATRRMALIPGGLQNFAEMAIEALLTPCEQFAGARGRSFLPLVGALFFFIMTANWMGILPFYAENDWLHEVPWTASHGPPLRSANSDLNATAAMAAIVFIWVQFMMIRTNGLFGWIKHLTWGPPPVLELISEIARPVSLALRLFGNIFAGEVLLLVMSSLIPPGVPFLFMAFELFVGVVQALIFAILTLAFLSLATTAHGGEEHGAAH
ncbi:MAG TPA: F0F1 ATP synthase subunit A [Chloroflexota bacterium]|nr:F0F1 ATP synthase subunit A [Chloroflexota bacterium]